MQYIITVAAGYNLQRSSWELLIQSIVPQSNVPKPMSFVQAACATEPRLGLTR
jgi:hypothetical protein